DGHRRLDVALRAPVRLGATAEPGRAPAGQIPRPAGLVAAAAVGVDGGARCPATTPAETARLVATPMSGQLRDAREEILARIRGALGDPGPRPGDVRRDYHRSGQLADPAGLFTERLHEYGATVVNAT